MVRGLDIFRDFFADFRDISVYKRYFFLKT